jgi:hypothetical protein
LKDSRREWGDARWKSDVDVVEGKERWMDFAEAKARISCPPKED